MMKALAGGRSPARRAEGPRVVGRPEAVGTRPEYRRRGLVRAQFEVIHAWSAERGELEAGRTVA